MGESLDIPYDELGSMKVLLLHSAKAWFRAELVFQGADIPATQEAGQRLHEKGTLSVFDIITVAGGVTAAAREHEKNSGKEAFEAVSTCIRKNTKLILEKAMNEKVLPGIAAQAIARERDMDAMKYWEY